MAPHLEGHASWTSVGLGVQVVAGAFLAVMAPGVRVGTVLQKGVLMPFQPGAHFRGQVLQRQLGDQPVAGATPGQGRGACGEQNKDQDQCG